MLSPIVFRFVLFGLLGGWRPLRISHLIGLSRPLSATDTDQQPLDYPLGALGIKIVMLDLILRLDSNSITVTVPRDHHWLPHEISSNHQSGLSSINLVVPQLCMVHDQSRSTGERGASCHANKTQSLHSNGAYPCLLIQVELVTVCDQTVINKRATMILNVGTILVFQLPMYLQHMSLQLKSIHPIIVSRILH